MSRSYKKTPIIKCCPTQGNIGKKFANRKVRNKKGNIPNGKAYKKYFESYDIHDYVLMETKAEFNAEYESDLKAYINGGLPFNPMDLTKHFTRCYDKNHWAKQYYRK